MKLKLPKIKFNLKIFLHSLFFAVIALELVILYQTLFLHPRPDTTLPSSPLPASANLNLDLVQFGKVYQWVLDRDNFSIPAFDLTRGPTGRENPFADYK